MTDKIQSIKVEFLNVLAQIETLETGAEQQEALSAIQSCLGAFNAETNTVNAATNSVVANPSQPTEEKPDLSQVSLWGGKRKDGSSVIWLDKHYGQWLKRCGADKNYIYRQDIVAHDKKLTEGVAGEARKAGKKSREYIPIKSDLLDVEREEISFASKTRRTILEHSGQPTLCKIPEEPSLEKEMPDLSQVPLWGGRKKDGSSVHWLDKYYGKWFKRCGADKNYIYRQDIMKHDRKLVKAVSDYAYKENIKARELLPTRSDLLDARGSLIGITPEKERIVSAICRRKYRSHNIITQHPQTKFVP